MLVRRSGRGKGAAAAAAAEERGRVGKTGIPRGSNTTNTQVSHSPAKLKGFRSNSSSNQIPGTNETSVRNSRNSRNSPNSSSK